MTEAGISTRLRYHEWQLYVFLSFTHNRSYQKRLSIFVYQQLSHAYIRVDFYLRLLGRRANATQVQYDSRPEPTLARRTPRTQATGLRSLQIGDSPPLAAAEFVFMTLCPLAAPTCIRAAVGEPLCLYSLSSRIACRSTSCQRASQPAPGPA